MKINYKTVLWVGNMNRWLGPLAMIIVLYCFFEEMIQNKPFGVLMEGVIFIFVSITYVNAMYELRKMKEKK